MRPFDRALLAVYTFFLTAVFLLFFLILLGWTSLQSLFFYHSGPELLWALLAVLILAGIRLFWVGIKNPEKSGRYIVLGEGADGRVRVSIQAIENLVVRIVTKVDGVREVKPRIVSVSQGVGIHLRVVMTPDINIPEVFEKIQAQVTAKVFEITGVTVASVRVSVENIAVHKPRVE